MLCGSYIVVISWKKNFMKKKKDQTEREKKEKEENEEEEGEEEFSSLCFKK